MPPHRQDYFILTKWSPKEASYGAGVDMSTGTVWNEIDEPALPVVVKERVTNENRVKGHHGSTKAGVKVAGVSVEEFTISFPLRVDLFQYFFKLLVSNGVEAGVGPYTQTMKEPAPGTNPFSTSFVIAKDRGDTATFKQYDGVICTQIEFTVDDGPEITCTATCMADGSEGDASAISAPAA